MNLDSLGFVNDRLFHSSGSVLHRDGVFHVAPGRLLTTRDPAALLESFITSVAFDMDGVIGDFAGAVQRRFGWPVAPPETWNFHHAYGVGDAELFDSLDEDFWAGLPVLAPGMLVYHRLRYLPHFFLTTPNGVGCEAGKRRWLEREVGPHSVVFTRDKHWCAAPGRLLIDDNAENCRAWRERGGVAWMWG